MPRHIRKNTAEGAVYLCRWRKDRSGVSIWLDDKPSVKASGISLEDAKEEIADTICQHFGDGEAVIELLPWSAADSGKGTAESLVALGYNESVVADSYEGLYSGGICSTCGNGIGSRTNQSLKATARVKGDIVGVDVAAGTILAYSERLFRSFRADLTRALHARSITGMNGRGGDYFEVVDEPRVKVVGIQNADYSATVLNSWRCPKCGWKRVIPRHPSYDVSIRAFVCESDIQPGDMFVVGGILGLASICMKRSCYDTWRKENKVLTGIATHEVAVVPDSIAEREPKISPLRGKWRRPTAP